MNEYLKTRWFELLASFKIDESTIESLWEDLVQQYSESHRAYHNLNHLYDLFTKLEKHEEDINDLKAVELAIWYHDVIYDPLGKYNEEKSAFFCLKSLKILNLDNRFKEKLFKLIKSTQNHEVENWDDESDINDNEILLDLDLSVLGSKAEDYEKYTSQIRREFNNVPSFLYFSGRKNLLREFLEMERIFKTDAFYEKYEKTARVNLKKEMEIL